MALKHKGLRKLYEGSLWRLTCDATRVWSRSAGRASAQVGDPASEVRFIVEGHARMEATFINLPDTHRAIEFPITLLTNGLEWCEACLTRWAGPADEGVERMQVATPSGTSPVFLG